MSKDYGKLSKEVTEQIKTLLSAYKAVDTDPAKAKEIIKSLAYSMSNPKPSYKQAAFATKISEKLGIPLPEGNTKKAYSDFISEHMEEFNAPQQNGSSAPSNTDPFANTGDPIDISDDDLPF